jgi:hypothetical protein
VGFFIPFWGGTKGHAYVDDYSGKLIRDLAGQPTSGVLTLVDLIAIELGETVDGLGFLDEGVFNALGYHLTLDTDVEIGLRPDLDVIGFTATLGGRYQINPVISLFTEFRVAGYNISTKTSTLNNLELRGEIAGNRDFLIINDEGGSVNGVPIDIEQLKFLVETEYVYELTEESNHPTYNPNGIDPTKPANELADRKSANGFTMSVGMQFNFGGRKKSKAAE